MPVVEWVSNDRRNHTFFLSVTLNLPMNVAYIIFCQNKAMEIPFQRYQKGTVFSFALNFLIYRVTLETKKAHGMVEYNEATTTVPSIINNSQQKSM